MLRVSEKSIRGRSWIVAIAAAGLCVLLPDAAKPQVDTGTIRGTITDSSGRPVPEAQVSITNQGTGFVSKAKSLSDGTYLFTPLMPAPIR